MQHDYRAFKIATIDGKNVKAVLGDVQAANHAAARRKALDFFDVMTHNLVVVAHVDLKARGDLD